MEMKEKVDNWENCVGQRVKREIVPHIAGGRRDLRDKNRQHYHLKRENRRKLISVDQFLINKENFSVNLKQINLLPMISR